MLIRSFGCYAFVNPKPENKWDLVSWVSRDKATRFRSSDVEKVVIYLELKGFRKIVVEQDAAVKP